MPILSPSEMPIWQYHKSFPDFISKTTIKNYVKNGAKWFRKAYIDKTFDVPTPEGAKQGLALDCIMTEGRSAFDSRYVVAPEGLDRRTSAGKAWSAENADKEILGAKDYAILMDAVEAIHTHPIWPEIEACQAQLTIRRRSEGIGIGLQSRPDWLNLERGDLFDCKKCRDLDVFNSQTVNLGYITQAALAGWCMAGDGIILNKAYLVAVEWAIGARCRVKEIDQEDLLLADEAMRLHAAEIADRIHRNDWDDHPPRSEMLILNKWQKQVICGDES